MKKIKFFSGFALVLFVFALILTACGSGSQPAAQSGTSASPQAAAGQSASPQPSAPPAAKKKWVHGVTKQKGDAAFQARMSPFRKVPI